MKYIGTYSNDTDIATKAKVDAKQDKVLANGILQGDGAGTISAAETQEVELVELTKADVGLGNVDNTSDANKPISTATQEALDGKQATITGGASTITSSNLTANRALVSDASGKVVVSEVTSTELGYLDGVTSNIQTQLNSKLSAAPVTSVNSKTGAVVLSASDVGAQPTITANGFLKGDGSGNITADKPVFLVAIEEAQDGTITGDKTPEEIYTAYSAGYAVYAVYGTWDVTILLPLTVAYPHITSFFGSLGITDDVVLFVTLDNTGDGWVVQEGQVPLADKVVPTTRTINGKPLSADVTLNATDVGALPNVSVTASDNGKFLRVVNGAWAAATVENANGVSF